MNNPLYSFRAADGVEYDASPAQLQDWVSSGKIRVDDTVTDFLNGQPYTVRDVLGLGKPPIAEYSATGYAAYPREQMIGGMPIGLDRKFNWGAFVLSWIWGLNHKKPIMLLAFFPIVGLIVCIWGGFVGTNGPGKAGAFGPGRSARSARISGTSGGEGCSPFTWPCFC